MIGLAFIVACTADTAVDEQTTATEPPPTSVTTETPDPTTTVDRTAPLAAAFTVVETLSLGDTVIAANLMRDSGDRSWVPFLIDFIRLLGASEAFNATAEALEALTGLEAPDPQPEVYRFFGNWMYDNQIMPAEGYVEWKAALYGQIDPSFSGFIASVDDPVVASRIQWGGVARNGIPGLDHQPVITVEQADYMTADELTFGVVVNGEARSYPHRILDHHELANDTLGGEAVALVDCTLCRTGVLYSRIVDGQELHFETSGLLINSNKIMVDTQTETLWEQLTGVAIAGPLKGTTLDRFPITVTRWSDWVAEHPDTDVLAVPTDYPYSYQPGDAYDAYYSSGDLWFPVLTVPDHTAAKEEVGTLLLGDDALAVSVAALADSGPQVFEIGGGSVAAYPTNGGVRFYSITSWDYGGDLVDATAGESALVAPDGAEAARLTSGHSFWFAWHAAHPDTTAWPGDLEG